jgi:hypothetical protein
MEHLLHHQIMSTTRHTTTTTTITRRHNIPLHLHLKGIRFIFMKVFTDHHRLTTTTTIMNMKGVSLS